MHESDRETDYETWNASHDAILLESVDKYISMKQQRDYVDEARAVGRHGDDKIDRSTDRKAQSLRPFASSDRISTANPLREVSLDGESLDGDGL